MTHIDLAYLPIMAQNDVGGTSTKNLLHWTQMMKSGDFAPFNYGELKNKRIYKNPTPPPYDVSRLRNDLARVDMLLITGGRDSMIHPKDYSRLLEVLPQSVKTVSIPDYNHVDYMWA